MYISVCTRQWQNKKNSTTDCTHNLIFMMSASWPIYAINLSSFTVSQKMAISCPVCCIIINITSLCSHLIYFTFVCCLHHLGRKRHLSAARRNAWAGGMLFKDSVSLTPLIQVFWGRPLDLWPLNLVLYAR